MFSYFASWQPTTTGKLFPAWQSTTNDIQQWLDAFSEISKTITSPSLTASVAVVTYSLPYPYIATNYRNANFMFSAHDTSDIVLLPYGNTGVNQDYIHFARLYYGNYSTATFSWSSRTTASYSTIFYAGIMANNKNLYATNTTTNSLLKVVVPTGTASPTPSNISITGTAWRSGCKSYDGKFIAFNDTQIMTFDPSTETATYLNHGRGSGTNRWSDCVQAANGKIYVMPYNTNFVMVYDPVAATTSTISVTIPASGFCGAVLGLDGNIYSVKKYAATATSNQMILRVNTSNDTALITGTLSTISFQMGSAKLGLDGKIYAHSRSADSTGRMPIFRINPSNLTVEVVILLSPIVYTNNNINYFTMHLGRDGNLWLAHAVVLSAQPGTLRYMKIPTSTTSITLSDDAILGKPVNKLSANF